MGFSKTVLTMKVFAAILLMGTLAQSRPRHILDPYDDEIEQPQVRFIPLPQQYNYRVARSAFPQEAQPAFAGGDAVDYGAYTGGYGAFGWYSDHPNHEGIGHRRRRAAFYSLDHVRVQRSPQETPLSYAPAPPVAGSTTY